MHANVFYVEHIKSCNGLMTFIRNICKKFKNLDIVVYYKTCESQEQLDELKKYVKVVRYANQKIVCEKAFFNKSIDIIDNVDAKEYAMILHTNYKAQLRFGVRPNLDKRITKYYGVSKLVCDTFKEITGKTAEPLYTPIDVGEPKKVLRLVSFTRLDTDDKAKQNYVQFASILEDNGIPYTWIIFTPDKAMIDKKGISLKPPIEDISSFAKDSHYVVQLSRNVEGFSLTVNEALALGVPIISTKQDVYDELGIDEKYGFIINEDLTDIPVKEIYEKAGTFDFIKEPPKSDWDKVLVNKPSKYEEDKNTMYLVEALDTYRINGVADATLKAIPEPGYRWEVDSERLDVLLGNNSTNQAYVKLIGEVKAPEVKKLKKNKIKVSVVIPVYNQEELIVKAINSIPERDDIEIIVVDDCSTDNTLKVLKGMKRKIKVISNEVNKGVGYTFNRGIDEAKGNYLLRMDSDDYMYPNTFNELVDKELDGTDMIYYNLEINSGKILPTTKENRRGRCGTVKFIRRDFIGATRCPEIRTAEDKYFNDALLNKGPSEKFTNKVLIHYNYPREGSLYNLTMKGQLKV